MNIYNIFVYFGNNFILLFLIIDIMFLELSINQVILI
jgi:hypothetical protein